MVELQCSCSIFAVSLSSRAHYLRAFRKRSGLSQEEVGFLLGVKNGAKISRYEQGHRIPPLHTAIAYAAIFNVPVQQLFPDLQSETQDEIEKRLWELRSRLEK